MARRRPPTVHGLAVVDKPAGVTSHDVVNHLRRRFGERRVGHAGTLDPGATGVLVVGVGHVTRLLRFVGDGTKRYTGEVVLGAETDTLDADGTVVAVHDMAPVDLDEVRAIVAERFVGTIEQVPPMVSAVQVGGRRLHELARAGVEVERTPRRVTVHHFDVTALTTNGDGRSVLSVAVECSAGTYVRTLAADLGHALGGGAHLRRLRRTAVGPFTVEEAGPPERCALLAPVEALRGLERLVVDDATAARIAHGALIDAPDGTGPWSVLGTDDQVLAVYTPVGDGRAKPVVVLAR